MKMIEEIVDECLSNDWTLRNDNLNPQRIIDDINIFWLLDIEWDIL